MVSAAAVHTCNLCTVLPELFTLYAIVDANRICTKYKICWWPEIGPSYQGLDIKATWSPHIRIIHYKNLRKLL